MRSCGTSLARTIPTSSVSADNPALALPPPPFLRATRFFAFGPWPYRARVRQAQACSARFPRTAARARTPRQHGPRTINAQSAPSGPASSRALCARGGASTLARAPGVGPAPSSRRARRGCARERARTRAGACFVHRVVHRTGPALRARASCAAFRTNPCPPSCARRPKGVLARPLPDFRAFRRRHPSPAFFPPLPLGSRVLPPAPPPSLSTSSSPPSRSDVFRSPPGPAR